MSIAKNNNPNAHTRGRTEFAMALIMMRSFMKSGTVLTTRSVREILTNRRILM